jgi:Leucine-rich repeat (LRR) protein
MKPTGSSTSPQCSVPANRKRRSTKAKRDPQLSKAKRDPKLQDAVPRLITTTELRSLKAGTKDVNTLRINTATPSLPPSFFRLFQNLRSLDLRRIGIRILPPQIVVLQNLQKLDLRYNNLTYLPSQIAQLSNLHHLQLDDIRDPKTGILKNIDRPSPDVETSITQYKCNCCINSNGQKTPPLPTLTQLCARTILSLLPSSASDDPGVLSWEDLESLYSTGIYEETPSNINQILPFPSHLLPRNPSLDICSSCSEIALPVHAQFDRFQVIALCRVRLRYVFCSHKCFHKVVEDWRVEQEEEMARKNLRETRFHVKEHDLQLHTTQQH